MKKLYLVSPSFAIVARRYSEGAANLTLRSTTRLHKLGLVLPPSGQVLRSEPHPGSEASCPLVT